MLAPINNMRHLTRASPPSSDGPIIGRSQAQLIADVFAQTVGVAMSDLDRLAALLADGATRDAMQFAAASKAEGECGIQLDWGCDVVADVVGYLGMEGDGNPVFEGGGVRRPTGVR